MDADIELIESSGLNFAAKSFLMCLVVGGFEVEIYDSFSELIFSKGFRWVRECDSQGYYSEMLETFRPGTKVALVRKVLFRDFTLGDEEDRAQIREMKTNLEYQYENSI